MSTIAFAQLTTRREEANPGTSSSSSSPGIKTYIDTFAALVPSEVLALHALIIANTTTIAAGGSSTAGTTTTIPPDNVSILTISFWIMIGLSIALYVIPRYYGGKWGKFDFARACIAPLAFVGWTMLQRVTAFDAAFPEMRQADRTVIALILGAILGGITAGLASRTDAAEPPK